MVVVIDQLEQRGLAKRLPRPEDRRAVAVTLTAKARRLLPALHEQGRDLENEIAAPLSAKERDTLRRLLQRVAAGRGSFPEFIPNWRDRRSLTNRPARRGNALVGRIP